MYLIQCWMDDITARETRTKSLGDAVHAAKKWYRENNDPTDTNGSCRACVVNSLDRNLLYFEIGGTEVPPAGIIYNPPLRLE